MNILIKALNGEGHRLNYIAGMPRRMEIATATVSKCGTVLDNGKPVSRVAIYATFVAKEYQELLARTAIRSETLWLSLEDHSGIIQEGMWYVESIIPSLGSVHVELRKANEQA